MNLKIDLWIDYKRKQKELNRSTQLLNEYKNAVDNSSEYLIDLIIVFIFQTILLPIVFLYFLYVMFRKIVL